MVNNIKKANNNKTTLSEITDGRIEDLIYAKNILDKITDSEIECMVKLYNAIETDYVNSIFQYVNTANTSVCNRRKTLIPLNESKEVMISLIMRYIDELNNIQ